MGVGQDYSKQIEGILGAKQYKQIEGILGAHQPQNPICTGFGLKSEPGLKFSHQFLRKVSVLFPTTFDGWRQVGRIQHTSPEF